jgi:hypothetical protein
MPTDGNDFCRLNSHASKAIEVANFVQFLRIRSKCVVDLRSGFRPYAHKLSYAKQKEDHQDKY